MNLPPPVLSYLAGPKPSHCARSSLSKHIPNVEERLRKHGFVTPEGRPTKKSQDFGFIDVCEGKMIWNLQKLVEKLPPMSVSSGQANTQRTEPAWVDFDVISTYFGVSKVKIGKWLDELGMREIPKLERNSSGDFDMLDVARQKQQEQSVGPIGKKPTEKAIEKGYARTITVTNRKQKEIEITQWNLDLVKALLVKAGHPLDTDHKNALKGKGKNSNVAVSGIDKRARELHVQWARLYSDPKTRWQAAKLFRGQPKAVLEKVEDYMKMPGYLTEGRYLKE